MEKKAILHHLVTKLLFLSKLTSLDFHTAVEFWLHAWKIQIRTTLKIILGDQMPKEYNEYDSEHVSKLHWSCDLVDECINSSL